MKAEGFRKVADYLLGLSPSSTEDFQEGIDRTIVGRYYYYVFILLRDENVLQVDNDKNNVKKLTSPGAHSALERYLRKLAKILKKKREHEGKFILEMAQDFENLKEERIKADYEMNEQVDPNYAKMLADKIEQNIKVLENVLGKLASNGELPKV